ncbi:MAG: ABC transporter permease [Bacilli bacterium]|nr:ABC transporter permease [Bacilli bacterium]
MSENVKQYNFQQGDFEFVQMNEKIFDKKFETKAVGYLGDAFRRFAKNKTSLVAFFILIFIVLMAIIVPFTNPGEKENRRPDLQFFPPRIPLLEQYGIADGTTTKNGIIVDQIISINDPRIYSTDGIPNVESKDKAVADLSKYIFVEFLGDGLTMEDIEKMAYDSKDANGNPVKKVDGITYNLYKHLNAPRWDNKATYKEYLAYKEAGVIMKDENGNERVIFLTESLANYRIACLDNQIKPFVEDRAANKDHPDYTMLKAIVKEYGKPIEPTKPKIGANGNWWFGKIDTGIKVEQGAEEGSQPLNQPVVGENGTWWIGEVDTGILEKANPYDSLTQEQKELLDKYTENFYKTNIDPEWDPIKTAKCYILINPALAQTEEVYHYFGTDISGRDVWTLLWQGTRLSLLIGLFVAVVSIIVGVVWGAISGYYGGTIDIIMERFTEILTGIPWIVIMTITKMLLYGKIPAELIVAISLVLTSWTGTASMVRAQMYRYKNREYVLASRTLGAKDLRLIFKHILPNAIGTIVTGCVLVIPSAIFFESSVAYLGLGIDAGTISVGNLLSAGREAGITTHPHLTIFPSLLIAVLMISFNMFGNGLRDALNPSLRGSE